MFRISNRKLIAKIEVIESLFYFRLVLPVLIRQILLLLHNWIPVVNPHAGLDTASYHNGTWFGNMSYLSILGNYGFLYGTLPTAPTVVIYAAKFDVEADRVSLQFLDQLRRLLHPQIYGNLPHSLGGALDYSKNNQTEKTRGSSRISRPLFLGKLCDAGVRTCSRPSFRGDALYICSFVSF